MILLQQAVFSIAEPLLNKTLSFDALAPRKLAQLENKTFAVVLEDIKLKLSLTTANGYVRLSSNIENPDTLVQTRSEFLKDLSDAAQLTSLIKQDKLVLEGDLNIAQKYSDLFLDNDIDWQEMLSKIVGDGAAYRISQFATAFSQNVKRKLQDMDYTVATGLTDELKVVPDSIEVSNFNNEVDKLSAQVEKLLSRVSALKDKL